MYPICVECCLQAFYTNWVHKSWSLDRWNNDSSKCTQSVYNADFKHSTQIGYIKVEAKIVETMTLLLKVKKCASILNKLGTVFKFQNVQTFYTNYTHLMYNGKIRLYQTRNFSALGLFGYRKCLTLWPMGC